MLGIMILGSPILFLSTLWSIDFVTLIYYLFAMGFSFLWIHDIRKKKTGLSSFDLFIDSPKIIIPLILTSIAIEFGMIIPIISILQVPDLLKDVYDTSASHNHIWNFLLFVIAAPFFEELIFRGIILDGFLKLYPAGKSIFLSAFLFGIFHLNPSQSVSAFILGLYMGWVYQQSQSIVLTMIIHAVFNFLAFLLIVLTDLDVVVTDENAPLYGGLYLSLVIIGCLLIMGTICLRYLQKHFDLKNNL